MPSLREYWTRAGDNAVSRIQSIGSMITNFLDSFKTGSNSHGRSRRRSSRSRRSQNPILGPPHLQRGSNYGRGYFNHGHSRHHLASSLLGVQRTGERNLWAALMSLLVIATLSAAIAQPKWLSIRGGPCDRVYIGLQEFYIEPFTYVTHSHTSSNTINQIDGGNLKQLSAIRGEAKILSSTLSNNPIGSRKKVSSSNLNLHDLSESYAFPSISLRNARTHLSCITPEIVHLQRTIIMLCFSGLLLNLFQFFLDTLGTKRKYLEHCRRHALANLIGVVSCIFTLGFAYLVADLLEKEQRRRLKDGHYNDSPDHRPPHVEIHFEISYYLISLAGLLGLIAAACNLLAKPKPYFFSPSLYFSPPYDSEANNLLEESIPSRWQPPPPTLSALVPSNILLPPPPPYSP